MAQNRFDPITLEVLWNRLISTVNEQAAALMHASFTTVVREAGDLSAGVFDEQGNMLAQAVTGTPGHINTMATCVRHFIKEYPIETLEEGDTLITNDPWIASGHYHDFTIVTRDAHFSDLCVLNGFPPKVIWLRLGNCTTRQVLSVLRARQRLIMEFAADPNAGTLVLS